MDKVQVLVNRMPTNAGECPFACYNLESKHFCCELPGSSYAYCIYEFKKCFKKDTTECKYLKTIQGTWCGPAVIREGGYV